MRPKARSSLLCMRPQATLKTPRLVHLGEMRGPARALQLAQLLRRRILVAGEQRRRHQSRGGVLATRRQRRLHDELLCCSLDLAC